ncbi:MAG: phosphoribosylglycinamide formyltransferase [Desulfobacterales bacterium]|jgi:phosphoribosylglycinamide formyltransferase-1|nr:phosphoribosylglycinamide formyltransferase [Desulfobacterales bacterium]
MAGRIRLGVLISGGGTNLQAIMDACENTRLDADVVCVGSDNPQASGLERARKAGIPTFVVDYRAIARAFRAAPEAAPLPKDFRLDEIRSKQRLMAGASDPARLDAFLKTRAIAEAALVAAMEPTPFDLLALAGFMRNFTPYFIDRVNGDRALPRIMNIHPALLPAFPGTDGYGDTFRYGCKVAGCTVHFVDYGEDSGPIIGQRAFPIRPEDSLETIRKRGLEREWELYPECIQLFAEGRLKTVRMTHPLPGGKTLERTVVTILPKS